MPQRTWILVADAARARLFETTSVTEVWQLIEDFQNPQGRAKSRDFRAAPDGDSGDLQGTEGTLRRSAMEPLSIKKVEAERFARALSLEIDRGLTAGRYDRLILVAPPEFLGMLRAHISPAAQKRIFDNSHVAPAARANDTTDIHVMRGGRSPGQPVLPFRTATLDHIQCGHLDSPSSPASRCCWPSPSRSFLRTSASERGSSTASASTAAPTASWCRRSRSTRTT